MFDEIDVCLQDTSTSCDDCNYETSSDLNEIFTNNSLTNDSINNENVSDTTTFEKNMSSYLLRTYLKYKDKYLIPEYICDEIFKDMSSILDFNTNTILSFIENCQKQYNGIDNSLISIITTYLRSFNTIKSIIKMQLGKTGLCFLLKYFINDYQK